MHSTTRQEHTRSGHVFAKPRRASVADGSSTCHTPAGEKKPVHWPGWRVRVEILSVWSPQGLFHLRSHACLRRGRTDHGFGQRSGVFLAGTCRSAFFGIAPEILAASGDPVSGASRDTPWLHPASVTNPLFIATPVSSSCARMRPSRRGTRAWGPAIDPAPGSVPLVPAASRVPQSSGERRISAHRRVRDREPVRSPVPGRGSPGLLPAAVSGRRSRPVPGGDPFRDLYRRSAFPSAIKNGCVAVRSRLVHLDALVPDDSSAVDDNPGLR